MPDFKRLHRTMCVIPNYYCKKCGNHLFRTTLNGKIYCQECGKFKFKKREIMIKIRVTANKKVKCPRRGEQVDLKECINNCLDCFGVVEGRYVNCKRGLKADDFLEKSGNEHRKIDDKRYKK